LPKHGSANILDKDLGFTDQYGILSGKRNRLFLYIINERGIKCYQNLHLFARITHSFDKNSRSNLGLSFYFFATAWDGSTRKHSISGTFALTGFVLTDPFSLKKPLESGTKCMESQYLLDMRARTAPGCPSCHYAVASII
jgi:hypothetical protein